MEKFTTDFSYHCMVKSSNCAHNDFYKECYHWDRRKYPILNDFFKTFPKMTFYFNGVIPYYWHPQEYLVQPLDSNTHYCVGVKTLSHMILGAIFMRNYDIHFDRTAKQIGFARSNCGQDPFFIDDLSFKPDDKPQKEPSTAMMVEETVLSPVSVPVQAEKHKKIKEKDDVYTSSKPVHNFLNKDKHASGTKVSETDSEDSFLKFFVILLILVSGILGGITLLKNLWKQSRRNKDSQSEVNTTINLNSTSG